MALRDPVVIYTAASNLEANLVRDGLIAAEVEAFVVEDLSQAGAWVGGLVPGIHKPQVWVDRADVARAKPVLLTFEQLAAERRDGTAGAAAQIPIEVVCEECDARVSFSASMRGSVQECPECGAYIDVEGDESSQPWIDDADADERTLRSVGFSPRYGETATEEKGT